MNIGTRVRLSSSTLKAACKGDAEGAKYHCRILIDVNGTVTCITQSTVVVRWDRVWEYDMQYAPDQIEAIK